jgi:hypothetical protein
MVLIGVDPHKASHTAVVIDGDEQELARVMVRADRGQVGELLAFAAQFTDRRWAIESAGGLLATAVAAPRDVRLRTVTLEDPAMVLRLLADRHQDLTSLRTQAVCRLHALLAAMVPGGVHKRLSANDAAAFVARVHPDTMIVAARRDMAKDLT